jgi:hypothetical protein
MAELQGINVRITGDASDLKSAATGAVTDINNIGKAADSANTGTARLSSGLGGLGRMTDQTRNRLRQTSMQLSQVGQQTMATGNFVQALAIQLPDIGLAFGAVGTAAGLLAGIALPVLMSAMSSTEDEARTLGEINESLAKSIDSVRSAGEESLQSLSDLALKYGTLAASAREFLSAIADVERVKAVNELNEAIGRIATTFGGLGVSESGLSDLEGTMRKIRRELELTGEESISVRRALDELASAKGPKEQALAAEKLQALMLEIYGTVEAMPEPARQLYANIATAGQNAASLAGTIETVTPAIKGAADEAARLSANLFAAAQQRLAASGMVYSGRGGDPRTSNQQGYGQFSYTPPAATGGTGAGVSPLFGDLASLQETLATEAELIAENYATQQETLQAALDGRLISQEEFQELSKRSAQAYADAMAGINSGYHGDALQQAGTFFGEMAGAMQSGNDKMLKIAKVFGAAEALVNAFRAYNQVLADPSLPWFAKIPAAMGVLSAGMGMVSAIKGAGSGGGSSGSSASAAAAGSASQPTTTFAFTIQNDPMGFGESFARQLIDQLNTTSRNGGNIRGVLA